MCGLLFQKSTGTAAGLKSFWKTIYLEPGLTSRSRERAQLTSCIALSYLGFPSDMPWQLFLADVATA